MKNITNYDLTDYVLSGELEKVAAVSEKLSEEAKEFQLPDFEQEQKRPQSDFALVTYHPIQGEMKKFARYNREVTEINLNLLDCEHKNLPDEIVKVAATNLVKAADDFGLQYDGDLREFVNEDSYIDPVVDITKVDDFAYRQKTAQVVDVTKWALPSEKRYPIEAKFQIEEAMAYFEKNAHSFDPGDAMEYAINVKKAAEEKDIDVSRSIEKFASLDLESFNEDLPSHIDIRKGYLTPEQDNAYELYEEFKKTANELAPTKAAALLQSIDKEANLQRVWGRGVENPLLSVVGQKINKTASSGPSLQELQALDGAQLTPIVGTDVVEELKGVEGVAVYNSLPMPIKREIDKLM